MGRALLATMLLAISPAAHAADPPVKRLADAERGRARAEELYCGACHGPSGASETPEWPSLAAQPAAYLAQQMQLLRARERASSEMEPIAASLSDEDIADLSAFYAALPPASGGVLHCEKPLERLYRRGDATRGIEPCAACHGADGIAAAAGGIPSLRGQQALYTVRQLEAYAAGSRYRTSAGGEDSAGAEGVHAAAGKLPRHELSALAQCLQGAGDLR